MNISAKNIAGTLMLVLVSVGDSSGTNIGFLGAKLGMRENFSPSIQRRMEFQEYLYWKEPLAHLETLVSTEPRNWRHILGSCRTMFKDGFQNVVNVKIKNTPLIVYAVKDHQKSVVKALCKYGANCCYEGAYSLLHATNNLEMIMFLVKKGCDINVKDDWGRTPLFCAAVSTDTDSYDLFKTLVDLGADVSLCDSEGVAPGIVLSDSWCQAQDARVREIYSKKAAYLIYHGITKDCTLNATSDDSPEFIDQVNAELNALRFPILK